MKKKNLLVTLADKNFVVQAKQLFSSAYFNAGWKDDMLLLTKNISKKDENWFNKRGIITYNCDDKFKRKNLGKWPETVLCKLFLFSSYFKQWKRVIFLDADMVIRQPINELLMHSGFYAVYRSTIKDYFLPKIVLNKNKIRNIREIKRTYNTELKSFSSCIFIFDTSMIHHNTFENIFDLYRKIESSTEAEDELVLNLIVNGRWNPLDREHCTSPLREYYFNGIKPEYIQGKILHFDLDKVKPWNPKSYFFQEWLTNYKKADKINNKAPTKKVGYNSKKYTNYKRVRSKKSFIKIKILSSLKILEWKIKRSMGLVGIFIRLRIKS